MRGNMDTVRIRKATEADVPALAVTAGLAFENDPLIIWLGQSIDNRQDICQKMFLSDWRMHSRFGLIYCEDQNRGFAVWVPPDARHTFIDRVRLVVEMASAVKTSRNAINQWRFYRMVDSFHPKQPHYYLSFLGVSPELWGKGVGPALIAPVLQRADQEGMPVYLETETEKNVRFYTRHGFKVVNQGASSDNRVQIWMMWRDPQPEA